MSCTIFHMKMDLLLCIFFYSFTFAENSIAIPIRYKKGLCIFLLFYYLVAFCWRYCIYFLLFQIKVRTQFYNKYKKIWNARFCQNNAHTKDIRVCTNRMELFLVSLWTIFLSQSLCPTKVRYILCTSPLNFCKAFFGCSLCRINVHESPRDVDNNFALVCVLSHSESDWYITSPFELSHTHSKTYHQRQDRGKTGTGRK